MEEHENVTVIIENDGKAFVSVIMGGRQDIVTVNAVRLSKDTVAGLRKEAGSDLARYVDGFGAQALMDLRKKEPIVCENDVAVAVPHGNARNIATDGQSAFIISSLNQDEYSFEEYQNATGEELKDYFNLQAKALQEKGLSLNEVFAITHARMKNAPHTQSPQIYNHTHLTVKSKLNSKISEGRWWVPHPKAAITRQDVENFSTNQDGDMALLKVPEVHAESKGHHVIKLSKSWADMLEHGTADEWAAWKDSWVNHEEISNYAQDGGLRITLEDDVMNFHGGEPLYQGTQPTRWPQPPSNG